MLARAHKEGEGAMAYAIACDIHTHTLYSRHAYSTITENVAWCQRTGIEVLGSSDHLSSMLFTEQDIRNFQFFMNVGVWPRMWGNVLVLRGAEVDILSLEGKLFGQDLPCPTNLVGTPYVRDLSLFERVTANLDYLVASVHGADFAAGATTAQATAMYTKVLENPRVMVLGHTGRSGVAYDVDEVLTVARELGKCIEINNHSLQSSRAATHTACRTIAERCAELGVNIVVSSDAHIAQDLGRFDCATSMLEEIHFPEELIANRNRAALLESMARAGVCDLRGYY